MMPASDGFHIYLRPDDRWEILVCGFALQGSFSEDIRCGSEAGQSETGGENMVLKTMRGKGQER